jgi:hypothetical protein
MLEGGAGVNSWHNFGFMPAQYDILAYMSQDNLEHSKDGRRRSGLARMEKLTPEQRSELGKSAAAKRWEQPVEPVYEALKSADLEIGDESVPCAVLILNGEAVRVVSERGLVKSFGGKRGGAHWRRMKVEDDGPDLPPIISAYNLRPFISAELLEILSARYQYKVLGSSGGVALGIRAEAYPMICNVFLQARDANALMGDAQKEIAKSADILMRALAHTGIIALVDEATGYQSIRPSDALARILEAFIAKELQPYVPTFPQEFYEELFRLRGLDYRQDSVKRPQYFGMLTNDIVYKRLAPGVLEELRKVTARNEDGRLKHKMFQKLTSNKGYPKLIYHLGQVVATMKQSTNYQDFISKLDQIRPRYGQTIPLPFPDYENGTDSGSGL